VAVSEFLGQQAKVSEKFLGLPCVGCHHVNFKPTANDESRYREYFELVERKL
tara:strand:- start:292 stop:447 length:156 start_codon:yes stop_codon:yes gene_type:complete